MLLCYTEVATKWLTDDALLRCGGYDMSVSYNRLWKLMIDKRISKTELTHMAGISTNAMAKLGRDEDVRMVVLEKICAALNCKIEDIVEIQNGDRLILEEQREIR